MSKYKHKQTGIIGETSDKDSFLHFKRGNGEVISLETISMELIEGSNDWELIEGEPYVKVEDEVVDSKTLVSIGLDSEEEDKKLIESGVVKKDYLDKLPTKWFETEQISTHIGGLDENGEFVPNGRGMLIVMHQCGNNKEVLISQLKTMIHNIETNGEGFGS
jgi:hypothetical protein